MIPVSLKAGATALERWLLNQERYREALKVRKYRGIADMHELTEQSLIDYWTATYKKKVEEIVGQELDIILDHIKDDTDFDRDWTALKDWMDDEVDFSAYQEKMKKRDAWLNSLSVTDIHNMGYKSDAFLFTRNVHGCYGWDDYQEECWRFPDGDEYREQDGKGYALKLGILDQL